ncbi:hypothetical protein GA0115256_10091, partial [Streptomyces sp. DconLS]
ERQLGIETLAGPGTPLLTVTEPTETATAAAFAHTARLSGRPGNAAPLAEAGRLFGRLAHLLDAVEDQQADAAVGAWNPLTATGTSRAEARRLADDAVHGIRLALKEAEFSDGALVHLLLVHELRRSVDRAFGTTTCGHTGAEGAFGPPTGPYAPGNPGNPEPQGPYVPGGPYGTPHGSPYGTPQGGGRRARTSGASGPAAPLPWPCAAPARCAAPTSSRARGRASGATAVAPPATATATGRAARPWSAANAASAVPATAAAELHWAA